MASRRGNQDAVQLLLSKGASANADEGKALIYAIEGEYSSIVKDLVHKGASIKETHLDEHLLSKFKQNYPDYVFKTE